MNLLRDQADRLQDAIRRLKAATDDFVQASQALRFASKRTPKRTCGTADVLEFKQKGE